MHRSQKCRRSTLALSLALGGAGLCCGDVEPEIEIGEASSALVSGNGKYLNGSALNGST